ncbi:MAG TPA: addiction module protein [Thermoanaerobaculia bacterium]|nr:addiction module protein [Thermoanaerobaculia bacterium]
MEEVVQKALGVGEDDRAEVASRLLDSLEQQHDAAAAAWGAELERRASELESGAVKEVSWEGLQKRLMRDHRGS